MHKLLFIVATVIISTGCSSSNNPSEVSINVSGSEALQSLVDISIEARDELRLLAKTQEALAAEQLDEEQRRQKEYQALATLEGFTDRTDFKFNGLSSKATEAIAMMGGYKFKKYGRPLGTFTEPWVSIDIKDEPLSEALRELGAQTGRSVLIEVHENAKLIRYVYQTAE
ncbi:DotD/TraH family lipoprotein [Vibrio breoganii]